MSNYVRGKTNPPRQRWGTYVKHTTVKLKNLRVCLMESKRLFVALSIYRWNTRFFTSGQNSLNKFMEALSPSETVPRSITRPKVRC